MSNRPYPPQRRGPDCQRRPWRGRASSPWPVRGPGPVWPPHGAIPPPPPGSPTCLLLASQELALSSSSPSQGARLNAIKVPISPHALRCCPTLDYIDIRPDILPQTTTVDVE